MSEVDRAMKRLRAGERERRSAIDDWAPAAIIVVARTQPNESCATSVKQD